MRTFLRHPDRHNSAKVDCHQILDPTTRPPSAQGPRQPAVRGFRRVKRERNLRWVHPRLRIGRDSGVLDEVGAPIQGLYAPAPALSAANIVRDTARYSNGISPGAAAYLGRRAGTCAAHLDR
jgi:hypothetical protein